MAHTRQVPAGSEASGQCKGQISCLNYAVGFLAIEHDAYRRALAASRHIRQPHATIDRDGFTLDKYYYTYASFRRGHYYHDILLFLPVTARKEFDFLVVI